MAVVAISLVIAIGTGVYAGLGSTATWRRESNDASFGGLQMHDLQARLSPGTFVVEDRLSDVVAGLPDAGTVSGVHERLVVDSQIEVMVGDEVLLVKSKLVGMDFDATDPVDDVWVRDGSRPSTGTSPPSGVLEVKFADWHDLPPVGTVLVAGGISLHYVGLGVGPEDFYIVGEKGSVRAEADLATIYLPLADAQDLVGRPGEVNDVVITIDDPGRRDRIQAQLDGALRDLEGVSAVVTNQDDAEAFRILYEDIENDQQVWNAISALVLLSAALAAFNLVSRIVESQRREIGIGMALGVPRSKLAIRPLLVGSQIAVLGTIAGVGVGLLLGRLMKGLLESFLPLPEYRTDFQIDVFSQAAVLGLAVPIVAAIVPVWRAVRVEPIEAIRTGHLAVRGSRWTDWTRRLRLPGSSLTLMPVRNLLRAPRRALLTAVGIAAAITALVAILSLLDSFSRTIEEGGDEVTKIDPDRMIVQLDTFYAVDAAVVEDIRAFESVGATDATLRLPLTAVVADPADEFEILLEIIDMDSATWTPTITERGDHDPASGLILARKAADDLGVEVGGSVTLRHPIRSTSGFTVGESGFTVTGIHPNPIRNFAFADAGEAERFGLAGSTNTIHVYPAVGSSRIDVQRDLFTAPGVSSTQAAAVVSEAFDEAFEQFVAFLFVTSAIVLVLALLIAYNSARITVDERRREHATMRAFGLPVRRVMDVVTRESVLIGVAATILGIIAGRVFLGWMLGSLVSRTVPDLGIEPHVSTLTLTMALIVGVLAVALASLFLVNRVRRMNIPDTLRVME